jgi:single-strand DNA-binding protein
VNKVILSGRLTKDPQVRVTQSQKDVCQFTIAVDRYVGDGKKEADFFNVVVWGKVAEACGNNLEKGQAVIVDGRLQNRSYDDKQGQKRYVTEVIAQAVEFGAKPKATSSVPPPEPAFYEDEEVPF